LESDEQPLGLFGRSAAKPLQPNAERQLQQVIDAWPNLSTAVQGEIVTLAGQSADVS